MSPFIQWPTNRNAKSSFIVSNLAVNSASIGSDGLNISNLTPSCNTSIGTLICNASTFLLVALSIFSYEALINASLACFDGTITKFIRLHPSTHSGEQISVSIPAVMPILYLPTAWNSFGIVHCIHTSGCDCNGVVRIRSSIRLCSVLFSSNAFIGVSPQLIEMTLISYMFRSINDLSRSRESSP